MTAKIKRGNQKQETNHHHQQNQHTRNVEPTLNDELSKKVVDIVVAVVEVVSLVHQFQIDGLNKLQQQQVIHYPSKRV